MIVVCTGCSAKFKVADEKVGPRGAKLRCSKCQTVFTVRREEAPAARAEPMGTGPSGLPPPLPQARRGEPVGPAPSAPPPRASRSVFEIDLEPAAPRGAAPDPFAAAIAPPDDPFAAQFSEAEVPAPGARPPPDPFGGPAAFEEDAFAAVQAPIPPELLHASPAGEAPASPARPFAGRAGDDPFAPPPPLGEAEPPDSADLALEERTTPRPRPARPPSSVSADDPFAGTEPGRGYDPLEGGHPGDIPPLSSSFPGEPFVGFTEAFSTAAPAAPEAPAPRPPGAEPPLREDPFAAAAVDADPLSLAPSPTEPIAIASAEAPEQVAPYRGRLRTAVVDVISMVVLLAVTLALLVVWRGGLVLAEVIHPAELLATLGHRGRDAGLLEVRQVTSGLYERQHGAPLLFVRGAVRSRAPGAMSAVVVAVDMVRGGTVLAHGEGRAGAVLTPEELHQAADAAALARLAQAAAARAPAEVGPGETVPFLVAIVDYPPDLSGATLRVSASGEARP